jgi:hypothetical protein
VKINGVLIARVGGAPQIRVGVHAFVAGLPEYLSDLPCTVRCVRVLTMLVRPLLGAGLQHNTVQQHRASPCTFSCLRS